jgi:HK97 family phage prohead protease
MLERRFLTLADERRVTLEERAGSPPSLQGYCVVYYRADSPGTEFELWPGAFERVMPGAFHESLRDGDDVRCFFNHSPNMILGRTKAGTLTLADFEKGLRYTCRLPATTAGKDVAESIRRGDVSGSSFAFTIRPGGEAWAKEGERDIRILTRLKLHDASVVVVPAYEDTTVGLRAAGELVEVRASHDRWLAERKRQDETAARLAAYRQRAESVGAK